MLARVSQRLGGGQNRAGNVCWGKFRIYKGSVGRVFRRAPSSTRWLDFWTDQMEFAAIEQFPLNGFACLHADGGG